MTTVVVMLAASRQRGRCRCPRRAARNCRGDSHVVGGASLAGESGTADGASPHCRLTVRAPSITVPVARLSRLQTAPPTAPNKSRAARRTLADHPRNHLACSTTANPVRLHTVVST